MVLLVLNGKEGFQEAGLEGSRNDLETGMIDELQRVGD